VSPAAWAALAAWVGATAGTATWYQRRWETSPATVIAGDVGSRAR
jgi:hypothetical protein